MRSDVKITSIAGGALALALAAAAAPAAAQTRFAWPDTAVDVSQYATVEQCLEAVDRVRRGLARREALTVLRDTMPSDPREALNPEPAPVTETAERCATRFPEASAKLADFAPLLALYLAAGRDADASALVDRRVAAVSTKNTLERTAIGDSAIQIYLDARPVRLDAAERILVARARSDGADRLDRMKIYANLMIAARDVGDTTRARRAAGWLVAVADSLTPAERESEKFETMRGEGGGRALVFVAMQQLMGLPVMLDSLRHSTAALISLERNMWAQLMRERPEALPLPIGERAPTIMADYWIPSTAGSTSRPTPGHVNYLIMLDNVICVRTTPLGDVGDACGYQFGLLRRLSERFAALDITLVTRTHGSFVYAPPPSPAEEVDMTRQWLTPYHIPRLTVAVTSTPFWNLARPDGRRIDKPTQNYTNYTFGKSSPSFINAYLIDQDGTIVALGYDESALAQYIEVLLQRGTGGGEHVAK
jgi:hypothetical protein